MSVYLSISQPANLPSMLYCQDTGPTLDQWHKAESVAAETPISGWSHIGLDRPGAVLLCVVCKHLTSAGLLQEAGLQEVTEIQMRLSIMTGLHVKLQDQCAAFGKLRAK